MIVRMQQRRGSAAEWTAANPVLASAEFGIETDTLKVKVGNGVTAWNALAYLVAGGGGGGGAVSSVNGETGAVVLTQDEVGDGGGYVRYSQVEKTKLAGIDITLYAPKANPTFTGLTTVANEYRTGSLRSAVNTITAAANLTTSSPVYTAADATAGPFAVGLPATTTIGYVYTIEKIDSSVNVITLTGTVEGVVNPTLTRKGDKITVVTTGTSGVFQNWGPSLTDRQRDMPTYITVPKSLNKTWDPQSGNYNFNARTMLKARAGLTKAMNAGKMNIIAWGDSTQIGYDGASTIEGNAYPRRLANMLSLRTGIRNGGTGYVPAWITTDRWSSTGSIDRFTYAGLATLYTGATITYTSQIAGTIVEAIYSNQSTAPVMTIDGGAPISMPVSGAPTMRREVLATGLTDTVHTVTISAPTGYVYLSHVAVRATTGIEVHNLTVGGTTADFGTQGWMNQGAAPTLKTSIFDPVIANVNADLVTLAIGGNDTYQGDTNAHAIAGVKKMVDQFTNLPSILLVQGPRLGVMPASITDAYLEAKYNLADQQDYALADFQHFMGTFEVAVANGLLGPDSIHPSIGLMYLWGSSTAAEILR